MPKLYLEHSSAYDQLSTLGPSVEVTEPVATITLFPTPEFVIDPLQQTAHLQNSKMLQQLPSLLTHLTEVQQKVLCDLIQSFPELLSDVPTQATWIQTDIEVAISKPIKRHAYRVNPTK